MRAEMPATVCLLSTTEGQQVKAGDTLLVLESMKMEIPVHAPVAGTVVTLCGGPGTQVEEGEVVAVIA